MTSSGPSTPWVGCFGGFDVGGNRLVFMAMGWFFGAFGVIF